MYPCTREKKMPKGMFLVWTNCFFGQSIRSGSVLIPTVKYIMGGSKKIYLSSTLEDVNLSPEDYGTFRRISG
jgi:hypothetical protein